MHTALVVRIEREQQTGARTETPELARPSRERVFQIIRDLALELHPAWSTALVVGAGSDLDRELGYDSLARAEVLLRLNRAFGIALPDQLIVEAVTAGDIAKAVASQPRAAVAEMPRAVVRPEQEPEAAAPEHAATLGEVLATHARKHPDRTHIRLWRGERNEEELTYGALDRAAREVAQGLVSAGVEAGDRVAIMLPTSLAFFQAFFGSILADAVPVPIYPPFRRAQIEDHMRRQAGILRNAEAVALVTDETARRFGSLLSGLVTTLRSVHTVADLTASGASLEAVVAAASDTALIQYTSGSTGDPKGVMLSHGNLLANIRAMGAVMEADSRDVFASWLPLYHDMGLIGAWLGSLYFAVPAVIMSPLAFIANPVRWLWAIHRHRATLSAAPNFAFELCLKRITDADLEGLDLSSLRMVVNGAEPVSPSTLERFSERFGKYGFRPSAMAPVYGLAENSVGLAFPPPGRGPLIDRIERRSLAEHGIARPTDNDTGALAIAACGRPLPGHQIRIVDATGREVQDRRQGRLEFKGPSATSGYFRNPEKTDALFDGDWLDSGDLAYVADGDIYLTGRVKDIIIRAGRNLHPHELEECVGDVQGVRKGCVAVIASTDAATGTERLVVVAETRLTGSAREALERRILQASGSVLEIPPEEIVLVPPHSVPKTSSGKIRRAATRDLYETGKLGAPDEPLRWQLIRLAASSAAGSLARAIRATGSFAYAAWWWTVLVLVAAVVWPLVVILPRRRWRHATLRHGARALFALTGIEFTTDMEADVPDREVVFVVNHTSYLDGAAVSAAISGPLCFVVTERFSRQFFAGIFLRRLGTLFVGEGGSELHRTEDSALRALHAGERLVVFPEGRLRRMSGLLSFYPGPFLVAAKASVPVVPVTLSGARSVLRHSGQWFPRRAPVHVDIGKPISARGASFEDALALSKEARDAMLAESQEPDLGGEEVDFGLLQGDR